MQACMLESPQCSRPQLLPVPFHAVVASRGHASSRQPSDISHQSDSSHHTCAHLEDPHLVQADRAMCASHSRPSSKDPNSLVLNPKASSLNPAPDVG